MKKVHQFILFICLTFMGQWVIAQNEVDSKQEIQYVSIVGQITNSSTQEIITGVTVTNETRNNTVLSRKNGFYTIVAATGDIIRFSSVGFEPIYMKINDKASSKETVMVKMDPRDITIQEVVVGELPAYDELNDVFMTMEIDEDLSRELAEKNPETFKILSEIEQPAPGGPVSFLKKEIFDKIKQKKRKKGRKKVLPTFKNK